jgi:peptide/nickel transport system substrate-binding protein
MTGAMPTGRGEPPGGVLRVLGSADVDHLDTASGYLTQTWALSRNFARTLVNSRGVTDLRAGLDQAVRLQPDVAAGVPTMANGGISPDGTTYRIRLRPDVLWNTAPPRPVTAHDFVRGIKRLANPAQPCGGLAYYRDTIDGMGEFCAGYAQVDPADPAGLARYQCTAEVAGLCAQDDTTLVIRLLRPASDFLHLLSLQFAAAAPAEYDEYLPDGPQFRQHTVSNGPYQISEYLPGRGCVLVRNPAWSARTDPVRAQRVHRIEVLFGEHSPEAVQDALESGATDLSFDQRVPTARLPEMLARRDENLLIADEAMSSPYLVFNLVGGNNRGALRDARIRQAIQYAVDKQALADIYGGAAVAAPLNQLIPPGAFGHRPFTRYPTAHSRGDAGVCRRLLAEAGHGVGIRLLFPYRTSSSYPKVAELIAANLEACGIEVTLIRDADGRFYGEILHSPEAAERGEWDIATPGWVPDWYGNNGRSSIVPLFDGRFLGTNSPNYGGYHNPDVNALIDGALQARSEQEAALYWHQTDRLIMDDAPVVPLLCQRYPIYRSPRVRNARYLPAVQAFEYNQVRLAGGSP